MWKYVHTRVMIDIKKYPSDDCIKIVCNQKRQRELRLYTGSLRTYYNIHDLSRSSIRAQVGLLTKEMFFLSSTKYHNKYLFHTDIQSLCKNLYYYMAAQLTLLYIH